MDQPGVISLYVALTAQNAIGCVSDLTKHEDDEEYLSDIKNEFSLVQTFGFLKKIGWLQVCISFLRTTKRGSEFSSYEIELRNRVAQNDVILRVVNSNIYIEIPLSSC